MIPQPQEFCTLVTRRDYAGRVYNLEVAGDHTYAAEGIVVHNCLCYLVPVARTDTDRVLADLGRWAAGEDVPGLGDLGAQPLDAGALTDWLTGLKDPGEGAP